MRVYNSKEPLISLHIAKAGGSSFKKVLQRWFHLGYHSHYRNYHNWVDPPRHIGLRLKLSNILPICIHGHFDESLNHGVYQYYPEAKQFITFLREPFESWVSMYNYLNTVHRARGESGDFMKIDDFFLNHPFRILDLMPFKFTTDNIASVIESNFIHIGIMEDIPVSMNIIAEKLNKNPITLPHVNISKFSMRPSVNVEMDFREKYKLEFAIYEYVKKLNSPG